MYYRRLNQLVEQSRKLKNRLKDEKAARIFWRTSALIFGFLSSYLLVEKFLDDRKIDGPIEIRCPAEPLPEVPNYRVPYGQTPGLEGELLPPYIKEIPPVIPNQPYDSQPYEQIPKPETAPKKSLDYADRIPVPEIAPIPPSQVPYSPPDFDDGQIRRRGEHGLKFPDPVDSPKPKSVEPRESPAPTTPPMPDVPRLKRNRIELDGRVALSS